MKKTIIILTLLAVFSIRGYSQDTLILNNQDIKLIKIISLKETSLHYYQYYNPNSQSLQPSITTSAELDRLITTHDPFYKNVKVKLETTNQNIFRGKLIGVNYESLRLISYHSQNAFMEINEYEPKSIKTITIPNQSAMVVSASMGALLFGLVGYKTEDRMNANARTRADLKNVVNLFTFNWGAFVEPEYVDRNQFTDTMIGAITGAAIGLAIGSLFKKKIKVNSQYTELLKGLSKYKREYTNWQGKVVITNMEQIQLNSQSTGSY